MINKIGPPGFIDVHAKRRLSSSFTLDGGIQTQFTRSHIAAGIRWIPLVGDRILEVNRFDIKAKGWQNMPNASLGYQFNDKVLMTLKGEVLLNLKYSTTIANEIVQTQGFDFYGFGGSIILEQLLGKKSHITLASEDSSLFFLKK